MQRVRLASTLAVVLFVAVSEAAVRPGTCPDPTVMKFACDGTRKVEGQDCTDDDQCSAGKKCCKGPCSWNECFTAQGTDMPPPTFDYDGCPPPTKELCKTNNPQTCDSTTKCGFGEKCCPISCNGLQCMPAGQKEGRCEDHVNPLLDCKQDSMQNSKADCAYDYQCDGALKCCQQTCVKPLCKAPRVVKPGQCPIHTMMCTNPPPEFKNECKYDDECGGVMKCCSTSCSGMKCQLPQPEPDSVKAGECKPVNWPLIDCMAMGEDAARVVCSADNQCEGTAKCCEHPCTEKCCLEPASCPYFDPHRLCLVAPPIECTPGTKNADGRTCCKYECGGARFEPEQCPGFDPKIVCDKANEQECDASDECGPDMICCSYECSGRRCVPRDIPAHSGYCPDYSGLKPKCPAVVPKNECENDDQCYAGKKCCKKMCGGMGCLDSLDEEPVPEPPKEGTPICPAYNENADCSYKKGAYTCNPDKECENGGKCCHTECSGTSCQVQLCPAPNPLIRCIQAEKRLCNSNSECAKGLVCCNTFCSGSKCMAPIGPDYVPDSSDGDSDGDNDGDQDGDNQGDNGGDSDAKAVKASPAPICPKPAPNRECPDSYRAKNRACTSDAACGSRKCCDSGCGINVCQTPIRPGTCPIPNVRCRAPTPADGSNSCGTDMSCPNDEKCCPSPCPGFGDSCMEPVV